MPLRAFGLFRQRSRGGEIMPFMVTGEGPNLCVHPTSCPVHHHYRLFSPIVRVPANTPCT
jgi:hypothetical protein